MTGPYHVAGTYFYFLQDGSLSMVDEITQYGSFQFASKCNRVWFSGWVNAVGPNYTLATWTGEAFETLTSMSDYSLGVENGYDISDVYMVDGVAVTKSKFEAAYAALQNSYDWISCYWGDIYKITSANIEDMMENPETYIVG